MRTASTNKARIATANKAAAVTNGNGTTARCPHCGLTARGCRPVPTGFFCQAAGLIDDPDSLLQPSPSDIQLATADDDAHQAAQAAQVEARANYDEVAARWEAAATAAAVADLKVTGGQYEMDGTGGWSRRRPSGKDRRRRDELAAEAADLRRERDAAWELVVAANTRVRQAQAAALARFADAHRPPPEDD